MRNTRESLLANLIERFKNIDENLNFAYHTFIDSRYKLTFFNESKKNIIKAKVVENIMSIKSPNLAEGAASESALACVQSTVLVPIPMTTCLFHLKNQKP